MGVYGEPISWFAWKGKKIRVIGSWVLVLLLIPQQLQDQYCDKQEICWYLTFLEIYEETSSLTCRYDDVMK